MFKNWKKKSKESGKEASRDDEHYTNGHATETRDRDQNLISNGQHTQRVEAPYTKPPRDVSTESERRSMEEVGALGIPDYMTDSNAVLEDSIPWRHDRVPDYSAANRNFLKEDLVSNLVKNWEKEASYKIRLQDWRTINKQTYKFSCNGGREYTADEMMQIGTYNALIQEAAFYSAKHTGFDESHEVFRRAMPGGFSWEVTEVYSGPPVVCFKWRHWGKMTGKLVCPIGPDTKLEADPTNQEVEIWGVCVSHLDSDFKISKLEIFYDPHELMASLVDARNLSYKSHEAEQQPRSDADMRAMLNLSLHTSEDSTLRPDEFSERDGARSMVSDSLASDLPSDAALLATLSEKPLKSLPGSRCPFPRR